MKKGYIGIILLVGVILLPALLLLLEALGVGRAFSFILSISAPIFIGVCIAFVMNIPMCMIEKLLLRLTRAKSRLALNVIRGVSVIFSASLVISVLVLVFMLIIPEAKLAVIQLINNIPEYMEALSDFVSKISDKINVVPSDEHLDWVAVKDTIMDLFLKYGSGIISATLDVALSIANVASTAVISVIISIYILVTKEKIFAGLSRLCCALFSHKATKNIFSFLNMVNSVFKSYVSGQVTEAVILGLLCFIGMTVFSFPYALMTASLMAVTALIPVFGAFIGAAGGAFMILTVSPIKALWFLVFILILQQLENNLIYPRVVGKSVGLPAMWVLISVTVAGSLFGMVGLLAGVPIASIIYCFASGSFDTYRVELKIPETVTRA